MPLRPYGRGHNLLEVVIAATIFCTVVLLFLGVWSSFYHSQTLARNRLAANSLARSIMEQKIAAGFYACDPAAPDPPGAINSISEIRGKQVNCRFDYQFYSADSTPTFRKLTVRVVWTDATGGDKSVTYETHLYRTN